MSFNSDFLLRQADPSDLSAMIQKQGTLLKRVSQGFVRVQSLDEVANVIGELQYRASDASGKLRMIMSAINLFAEFGIQAHFAGFDPTGIAQFWVSADDGSLIAGAGNVSISKNGIDLVTGAAGGNRIEWYTGTVLNGRVSTVQILPINYNSIESYAQPTGPIVQARVLLYAQGQSGGPSDTAQLTLSAPNTGSTSLVADVTLMTVNGSLNLLLGQVYKINNLEVKAPSQITAHALSATVPASTTFYLVPGTTSFTATISNLLNALPGTLKNFGVRTGSAQPASGSLVCTVFVNNVATALTFTIAAGAAIGTYKDTTHTVTVAADDRISLEFKNNATGVSASVGGVVVEQDVSLTT